MRILHISADYPDPLQPAKTKAVANLLALAPGHEHRMVSINRVGWRLGVEALSFRDDAGEGHRAVAYGAPPKGVLMHSRLLRLAAWIAADCEAAGFAPDLIHAHKLSVEGLVAFDLAVRWGAPFAVSVQGDSDLAITGAKRSLRPLYDRIWKEASLAFPFAPWARDRLDARLGRREGATVLLPCPGPADALLPPVEAPPVIVTAFHFASAGRKNVAALIRAVGRAAASEPEVRLDVIGGGDPAAFARLAALARDVAPERVRFLGALPHGEVQKRFNAACGFALVSKRESFGMVFAEALLAGAPCLIPRGWGIDGYLEEGSAVISADSGNEAEIAAGLVRLVREQATLKARLAALGASGALDLFRRDRIAAAYRDALEGLVTNKEAAA